MKGSKFSRRDLLIGSSALAAGAAFSTRVLSAAPPASAVTPALIEAAKKEGKVVWYTSVDLKLSEQIGKAFEAKYPGVVLQGGAHRRRAPAAAHRSGIFRQRARGRRGQLVGRLAPRLLERQGHAGALRSGRRGEVLSGRAQGCGRHVRQLPRLPLRHRLQHQSGEKGRGAQELRRSARSEMEGQDHQGASGLQRHHHDRDLPDARAISAGATSRSSPSRTSCRCSRPPIRRRSSRSASARSRPTASNT